VGEFFTSRDAQMQNCIQTITAHKRGEPIKDVLPQLARTKEITISCYENEVPSFVEAKLDHLYQHINSSLSHHAVKRKAKNASTYLVHQGRQLIVILLFTRERGKVRVINEMIRIEPEEIQRFAAYIFTTYKSVSLISFSLIEKTIPRLPFPCQQHDGSEDIVLTLPSTPEAYLECLSKKMRSEIRHDLKALARDFPAMSWQAYERDQIKEEHIRELINLKKINMSDKHIKFGLSQDEIEWIIRRAKMCGLLTVATIEDRVCAGSISLRIGDNYFPQIVAHASRYNKYSLGILCCYLTICDQIRLGAKESHLCWGRNQFKYKLTGVQRDMASLDIYRSRIRYYWNADAVMKNALKTYLQQCKRKILDMEHKTGSTPNLGGALVKVLRRIKRFRLPA
jgi:hypothetical protein